MFVGREKELAFLREVFNKGGYTGVFLSGRKRVGKTSLLKEAEKTFDGKIFHFEFLKSVSSLLNIEAMVQVLSIVLPDLKIDDKPTFKKILDSLFQYSIKNKLLIVLDEYQNYRIGDFDADDVLLKEIEAYKKSANLTLIISSSDFKKINEALSESTKLNQDFKYRLSLDSFDYYDFAKLLPSSLSLEDKIKYYSVFGGTPYYVNLLDFNLSFEENIKQKILIPSSPFETEMIQDLGERIMRVDTALFLLSCIGRGEWRYSTLKEVFGDCFYYSKMNNSLYVLLELKIVDKKAPLNADSYKDTYYEVKDNFLDFYSSLVFPNEGKRQVMTTDEFFDSVIKPALYKQFLPKKLNQITREFLQRKKGEENKVGLSFVGAKKQKFSNQFVVTTQNKESTIFFKINCTNNKVGLNILDDLKVKLNDKAGKNKYGIFSLGGFKAKAKSVEEYELKDFFAF